MTSLLTVTDTQQTPSNPSAPIQVELVKRGNGLGVAAIVVGSVALVGALIPFLNYATGFLAFIGLVLGVIGLFLKGRAKGSAIAGSVISFVAIVLSIVLAIAYTAGFAAAVNKTVQDENVKANKTITLQYDVIGSSTDGSITYATYSKGTSGTEQVTDPTLPFTKTLTVKTGGTFDFTSYSLLATNGSTGTSIECKITLDGKVVADQTSSGAYATADCTYSK
jgi:hypothetical protein